MIKKILITGANSYIGTSFERHIVENYENEYQIDTLDMMDSHWKEYDFTDYDSVLHVAGIAHADVGNVSEETKKLYYKVNTDLTIETALKAKEAGVKQFIYMSSIIVYGESAPLGKRKVITKDTVPSPANFYGDSKLQADLKLQTLNTNDFKVCIIRPPMIYGPGSKGNYQMLSKLAKKLSIFPNIKNERSMLFVGNLCSYIKECIDMNDEGIKFPQNNEYISTSQMVKEIAKANKKDIHLTKILNPFVYILSKVPGKIGGLCNKAFGNLIYEKTMVADDYSTKESIKLTEKEKDVKITFSKNKKKILLIALPGYSKGIRDKMEELGYEVLHINDKPNEGVICKTLGRLKIPLYTKKIDKYYKGILRPYEEIEFNYVVSIRGEYTPNSTLNYLATTFPKAKRILYMWDSIINNKGIEAKWHLYDKVFTFDRIDYLNYKDNLSFLALYYYEDYLSNSDIKEGHKYDVTFIGTGHGDRVMIANQVKKQCIEKGLSYFVYIYSPHKLIYLRNKLLNPYYKNVEIKDLHFEMLPLEKAYEIYGQSKCVMDIESKTQNGLTMRTIEMIGLKKKLITTNREIMNYDFFDSRNIMIANRKDFRIDLDFIKREYATLNESTYKKYALGNWIKVLLGEDENENISNRC